MSIKLDYYVYVIEVGQLTISVTEDLIKPYAYNNTLVISLIQFPIRIRRKILIWKKVLRMDYRLLYYLQLIIDFKLNCVEMCKWTQLSSQ